MRLEADQPVDDMRPRLLELAGPVDVRLLVEAGLDLDQDDDLLAALSGGDQVAHDGRVAAGPIQSHLDREDFGVGRRLGDEPLRRRGEALVGMVDQQISGPDGGKHVDRFVLVRRLQACRHDRRVRGELEIRPIEAGELHQAGLVEHAADLVAVFGADADPALQDLPHRRRHAAIHLEAHRVAEAPPPQLLLDRQQQVVGLVLLEVEVGVAGDAEEMGLADRHAGEEHVQVGGYHLLDEDELARLDLYQARQQGRHLDPGE